MVTRKHFTFPNKQTGLALLVLVSVVMLAALSFFVAEFTVDEISINRQEKTLMALKKARQALIAYAVNYPKDHSPRGPGYLLCPDNNNDGLAQTGCNGAIIIGRFPWKTLNVGDLRDGSNERLWYAVSENFDYTGYPTGKAINTSTTGNITVRDRNNNIINDGTQVNAAIAVIISPGSALTRDDGVVQDRSGGSNAAMNYLDIDTASGEDNASFVQGIFGDSVKDGFIKGEILNAAGEVIVNDIIEVITYEDIMQPVHKRVYGELRNAISGYQIKCGAYPEASDFNPIKVDGTYDSDVGVNAGHIPVNSDEWDDTGCAKNLLPEWILGEDWHRETYYHYATAAPGNCVVATDCLIEASSGVDNIDALIVFSGRVTAGQVRGVLGSNLTHYFENENSNFDLTYDVSETEDYVGIISP